MNAVEQVTALIDNLESKGFDKSKYGILLDAGAETEILRDGTQLLGRRGFHRGVAMFYMRSAVGVSLLPVAVIDAYFESEEERKCESSH